MLGTFRSKELNNEYLSLIKSGYHNDGCKLCAAVSLVEFKHWRIVENKFPYDLITRTHHMIIPKMHIDDRSIDPEQWAEYQKIKSTYINENYEYLLEPTIRNKSIPTHFHMHLLNSKFFLED